eukprot:4853165-Pleurochrysis_carterae.AAC.7
MFAHTANLRAFMCCSVPTVPHSCWCAGCYRFSYQSTRVIANTRASTHRFLISTFSLTENCGCREARLTSATEWPALRSQGKILPIDDLRAPDVAQWPPIH